ncbi:hypothetical protein WDU94_005063 [Cyamophila willieti]
MPVGTINKGAKERLGSIISLAKTVFHIGYIPVVLYYGLKSGGEGGEPLSIFSLIW